MFNDMRDRAYEAAAKAHAESDSPLYGGHPYTVHLLAVEQVVLRYFEDTPYEMMLRIGAMLHDAIEDTDLDYDDVLELTNEAVAGIVEAVTDEPGKNRKEKKGRTYPKIRRAGGPAIYLKLADRIANWENCHRTGDSKHWMYYKEHWGIYGALYDPDDTFAAPLWARLHELYTMSEDRGEHRRPKKKR